jgi:DNA-binding transcriptional LysR family regulator
MLAAELGSFTKAAEIQGYSQPTVSFQIRQLEQELGCMLFERVNHTIALTDKGREVLLFSRSLVKLENELMEKLRDDSEVRGLVRLAAPDSLTGWLFGEPFAAFWKQYPGITLRITTAGTQEMFSMLDHNETDLVLTLDSPIYSSQYIIRSDVTIPVHFVANRNNPLAGRESLHVADLLSQPLLMTEKGMSYRKVMEDRLAQQSLEMHPVLEMGNVSQLCALAAADAGISLLPDFVTQPYIERGEIVYLPVDDCPVETQLQLIYHKDKWIWPAMEKMIGYLMSRSEE